MSRILCSTGVYRKWNARLFEELYRAYVEGPFRQVRRVLVQGRDGFFDFTHYPVGEEAEGCGVFGVSSDEYLNYAP
jgi:hypothetical protein